MCTSKITQSNWRNDVKTDETTWKTRKIHAIATFWTTVRYLVATPNSHRDDQPFRFCKSEELECQDRAQEHIGHRFFLKLVHRHRSRWSIGSSKISAIPGKFSEILRTRHFLNLSGSVLSGLRKIYSNHLNGDSKSRVRKVYEKLPRNRETPEKVSPAK